MEKLILVCEDDCPILEVTKAILEEQNMRVMCALDCVNIIEKALKHRPDLILMDVWIPEIGGEEATRLLKNDPRTCHIPVILFSAVNHLEVIAERCGADGIIKKPFELEELVDTIKNHLGLERTLSSANHQ